jgi:hypothetical protein
MLAHVPLVEARKVHLGALRAIAKCRQPPVAVVQHVNERPLSGGVLLMLRGDRPSRQ